MFCKSCNHSIDENDRFCANCGRNQQRNFAYFPIFFIAIAAIMVILSIGNHSTVEKTALSKHHVTEEIQDAEHIRTELIESALKTVYTIYTDFSQGSGFLYNENGIVVTNAHVVEGSVHTIVKTSTGEELFGEVIGYSI